MAMKRELAKAFTLLEILVVVAITAGLAAVAFPAYQRIVQGGNATVCSGHLRQLGIALNSYLTENNMIMPVLKAGREKRSDNVPVIDNTLAKSLTDTRVFACPADGKWFAATGTS